MALNGQQIESLANGLAGALGASIGCFCVAPLGLIVQMKTTGGKGGSSEQGLSSDKLSVVSILAGRIQSDGFLGLWRGEWMNAIGNFQSKFGFFFCYSVLKQWYETRWGAMGKLTNVVVGYFAKLLPLPLVYPPQVLTNRMQTSATPIGPRGALKQVLEQGGTRGLWTGAESYFILAIWPALEQAIFDQIKAAILVSRGLPLTAEIGGGMAFLLGAVGRFIATTMVFPIIRTRSLCQKGVYSSVPAALRGMLAAGGVTSFYSGLPSELVRGVTFNAVIMSIKEVTVVVCRRLLLALLLKRH